VSVLRQLGVVGLLLLLMPMATLGEADAASVDLAADRGWVAAAAAGPIVDWNGAPLATDGSGGGVVFEPPTVVELHGLEADGQAWWAREADQAPIPVNGTQDFSMLEAQREHGVGPELALFRKLVNTNTLPSIDINGSSTALASTSPTGPSERWRTPICPTAAPVTISSARRLQSTTWVGG
jgi:hypothetical protein